VLSYDERVVGADTAKKVNPKVISEECKSTIIFAV